MGEAQAQIMANAVHCLHINRDRTELGKIIKELLRKKHLTLNESAELIFAMYALLPLHQHLRKKYSPSNIA